MHTGRPYEWSSRIHFNKSEPNGELSHLSSLRHVAFSAVLDYPTPIWPIGEENWRVPDKKSNRSKSTSISIPFVMDFRLRRLCALAAAIPSAAAGLHANTQARPRTEGSLDRVLNIRRLDIPPSSSNPTANAVTARVHHADHPRFNRGPVQPTPCSPHVRLSRGGFIPRRRRPSRQGCRRRLQEPTRHPRPRGDPRRGQARAPARVLHGSLRQPEPREPDGARGAARRAGASVD